MQMRGSPSGGRLTRPEAPPIIPVEDFSVDDAATTIDRLRHNIEAVFPVSYTHLTLPTN